MSNLTKFFDFRFSKKAKCVILGIMIFDQLVQQPKLEEHMENMTSLNIFSRHLHQRRSRGAKRMLLIVYQEFGQDFPSFLISHF